MGLGISIGLTIGPQQIAIGEPASGSGTSTVLAVALADSGDPVFTGGATLAYTAIVANTGDDVAPNVSLVVTLDASLTYVSASGTGWTCNESSGVVTCTRATLAAHTTAPTVTINTTTGGAAITASTSTSATADNVPSPGTDVETTSIEIPPVAQDATSGIFLPATAAEWDTILALAGVTSGGPSSLYLLQEASGNIADTIGGLTMTATGGGPDAYQAAVAGWATKAVEFNEAATGYFKTNDAGLPDPATTSWARIMIALVFTGGSTANMYIGGTAGFSALARNSGGGGTAWQVYDAGASVGAANVTDVVRPFAHVRNVTGSAVDAYTDNEHISVAIGGVTGKESAIGTWAGNPHQQVLYCADFFGAAAELSTANVRAILQALGWTVSW